MAQRSPRRCRPPPWLRWAAARRTGNDANEIDIPITGPDLARGSEVAIDHLGGGTVTETEIQDEESYYEVEVTLDDGRQVDVQLDEQFNVVGTEDDGTGADYSSVAT